MPELPEVETCRQGLLPHVVGHPIKHVIIRESRLRWPIPANLPALLAQQTFTDITRRGKYLLFHLHNKGILLLHLGMSGRVRILPADTPPGKHDHVDIVFDNNCCLRFNDSRRFGAILWVPDNIDQHPLLKNLGPEPLTPEFNATYLHKALKSRQRAIKLSLMDNHIVTGVGNIYANEALFRTGINPNTPSQKITPQKLDQLITVIKQVLIEAIAAGGTTLRDFISADGSPGYFKQKLDVYGRGGKPCRICETTLMETRLGQRSTVYCLKCQK